MAFHVLVTYSSIWLSSVPENAGRVRDATPPSNGSTIGRGRETREVGASAGAESLLCVPPATSSAISTMRRASAASDASLDRSSARALAAFQSTPEAYEPYRSIRPRASSISASAPPGANDDRASLLGAGGSGWHPTSARTSTLHASPLRMADWNEACGQPTGTSNFRLARTTDA
jgi:hypothetical protein